MATLYPNGVPPLEHQVDLTGRGAIVFSADHAFWQFLKPAEAYDQIQGHTFFRLHPEIRRRVYDFVFPYSEGGIPITLSPEFAIADVYDEQHFLVPWEVLWPVEGAMYACKKLREELLIYFWGQYEFHIVLSPFTAPTSSHLTLNWMPQYLDRIQYLTIEADFTRLAFSAKQGAGYLQTGGEQKVKEMIIKIVAGLMTRCDKYSGRYLTPTMAKLHLKIRRYEGFRPETESQPYCPNGVTFVFDSVMENMSGILVECRVSGFSSQHGQFFLQRLFGDAVNLEIPSIFAWPVPPGSSRQSAENRSFANIHPALRNAAITEVPMNKQREMPPGIEYPRPQKRIALNRQMSRGPGLMDINTDDIIIDGVGPINAFQTAKPNLSNDDSGSSTYSYSGYHDTQITSTGRYINPAKASPIGKLNATFPVYHRRLPIGRVPQQTPRTLHQSNFPQLTPSLRGTDNEYEDKETRWPVLSRERTRSDCTTFMSLSLIEFITTSSKGQEEEVIGAETLVETEGRISPNTLNRANELDPAFRQAFQALSMAGESEVSTPSGMATSNGGGKNKEWKK